MRTERLPSPFQPPTNLLPTGVARARGRRNNINIYNNTNCSLIRANRNQSYSRNDLGSISRILIIFSHPEAGAATVYAIPAQLDEARRKAHDALDAVLDAKKAHMRAMFGGAG